VERDDKAAEGLALLRKSWPPSGGRGFPALAPGEPFFYKTHYPHNKVIGCLFVRDVRFFPQDLTMEPPPGFAPNIVQGRPTTSPTRCRRRGPRQRQRVRLGPAAARSISSEPCASRPGRATSCLVACRHSPG
jgi:hypothetical protein